MKDDDFGKLLLGAIIGGATKTEDNNFSSVGQAQEHLENYLNQKRDFEVGDYIERNEHGLDKYRLPSDNMAMKVVHILPEYTFGKTEEERGYNCIAACAINKKEVRYFPIDTRCYKKAGDRKNVSFLKFGK